MDLLFPDQGLPYQLQQILTPGVKYRLFANDVMPTLDTVLADLTEAAWPGYGGPILRNWANYTSNGVSGHNGFAIAPAITFGNTSGVPQSAYGYYVTDPAGSPTKLLAVARFDSAPVVIPNGGTTIVIPTWGDFSQLSI
jgi:hypothetical protein